MPTVTHGEYEWDEAKARRNVRAHGITFLEAATVLLLVPYYSPEHSVEEPRYVIIGQSERSRLLAVAYAVRRRIRIISARKVTPRERKSYEESEKNSNNSDDRHDPLAKELDFTKLERVGLGPGWSQVPKHLRSPKHLREARAWLNRKSRSAKPRRAA